MTIISLILLSFGSLIFARLNFRLATEVPVCKVHSKARNENARNADHSIDELTFGTGSIVVAFAAVTAATLTLFRLITFFSTCLIRAKEYLFWISSIV